MTSSLRKMIRSSTEQYTKAVFGSTSTLLLQKLYSILAYKNNVFNLTALLLLMMLIDFTPVEEKLKRFQWKWMSFTFPWRLRYAFFYRPDNLRSHAGVYTSQQKPLIQSLVWEQSCRFLPKLWAVVLISATVVIFSYSKIKAGNYCSVRKGFNKFKLRILNGKAHLQSLG